VLSPVDSPRFTSPGQPQSADCRNSLGSCVNVEKSAKRRTCWFLLSAQTGRERPRGTETTHVRSLVITTRGIAQAYIPGCQLPHVVTRAVLPYDGAVLTG
jgi:hypothetical protein